MPDRSDELRRRAADCLALALATSDPYARVSLLTMAQRLYTMANAAVEFDSTLRNFNDEQMMRPSDGKPVMQQQQQIQPEKEDDKN